MSECRNGRMAGWQDGRMAGWQDGRMAGWQDGRMAGWQDGRMAGCRNGRMAGCRNGRMAGCRNGRMGRQDGRMAGGWQDPVVLRCCCSDSAVKRISVVGLSARADLIVTPNDAGNGKQAGVPFHMTAARELSGSSENPPPAGGCSYSGKMLS